MVFVCIECFGFELNKHAFVAESEVALCAIEMSVAFHRHTDL